MPAILAATLISKDPAKYGFDIEYDDRIDYDSIEVDGAADLRVLAKCAGTDFDTMRLLNPALSPPLQATGSAAERLAELAAVQAKDQR